MRLDSVRKLGALACRSLLFLILCAATVRAQAIQEPLATDAESAKAASASNKEAPQCTASPFSDVVTRLTPIPRSLAEPARLQPVAAGAAMMDPPTCEFCWTNYWDCIATCRANCGPAGSTMCIACETRGCATGRDNCLSHCTP